MKEREREEKNDAFFLNVFISSNYEFFLIKIIHWLSKTII